MAPTNASSKPSSGRYSFTIFGASGFTGTYVVEEVCRQLHAFRRSDTDFTWAIAGRNTESLEALVGRIRMTGGADERDLPGIVRADVKDEKSLEEMAKGSRLILTCVGPYAMLGEPVVRTVISASEQLKAAGEPGCDYADLCGEPSFIERMHLKYHEAATRADITILHAAGWDSIPADVGVLHAKRELMSSGAVPTSIELFFRLGVDANKGFGIHYATYAAAVNGFATRKELSKLRKELAAARPKPAKPVALQKGLSSGTPSRKGILGGLVNRANDQGGVYLLPFFFADPAVVRLTQTLDGLLNTGVPPVTFAAYIVIPSLPILLVVTFFLSIFGALANYPWGRSLLLNYPSIFSAGLVSHAGPTPEQLAASSFTSTLVARGHTKPLLDGATQGSRMGPDVRVTTRVTGPEVGYVSTPICYITAARVILNERKKVRKGVVTPAVALGETSIVEQLNEDGRVRFTRVE